MASEPSAELDETTRIPTKSGLPNLRLVALFSGPVLRSCIRSPRTIAVFNLLSAAEGLVLCGKPHAALKVLSIARSMVAGRGGLAEALVMMALGRTNALTDVWEHDEAEFELRRAKAIFEALPWNPLRELLLLWTTVILAHLMTERDTDVANENAKELALEAKVMFENCLPFWDPATAESSGGGSEDGSVGNTNNTAKGNRNNNGNNNKHKKSLVPRQWWRQTKDWAHRKLAWFRFYMWAAVSTTAVFFHTDCAVEGLELTCLLLDVARRREGLSSLTIELQFAVGVFLNSQRDYAGALEAYRTARELHVEKRARSGRGAPTGSSSGGGGSRGHDDINDPLMHFYIAICLSRLGRDAEVLVELDKINFLSALVHGEGEFFDSEDLDCDLLALTRKTYHNLGQHDEVVRVCEAFALLLDEKLGPSALPTLASMEDHAAALRSLGQLDDVAHMLRRMLDRQSAYGPPSEHERSIKTALQLGDVLRALGEHEEAAFYYRKTLESPRLRPQTGAYGGRVTGHGGHGNDDDDDDDDDGTGAAADLWPLRRFALVQLARLYERLDVQGERSDDELQSAFSHLQDGFRAAPPTHANVARYFWYRGRLFASKDKLRLAGDMFARARAARVEEMAEEEREREKREGAKSLQHQKTEVNQKGAGEESSTTSIEGEQEPTPGQDECLATIDQAIAAVKAYKQPRLDPFPHDDVSWPLDHLVPRSPLDAGNDDDDDDDDADDAIATPPHNNHHNDPRIEPSLAEECSAPPFALLPDRFDTILFASGQRARAGMWARRRDQSRAAQVYVQRELPGHMDGLALVGVSD